MSATTGEPATLRPFRSGERGISEVTSAAPPVPNVSDVSYVLLAFKCCIEPDDHIVNKLAVWITAYKKGANVREDAEDNDFRGRISHVEILVKQRRADSDEEGEWYRYSIMKKIGRRMRDGKVVFEPGKVHRLKTGYVNGKMQVKNYRFYRVELGIDGVNDALTFLDAQVRAEAPFNKLGYALNFVSPVLVGVAHYKQAERRDKNSWFCTEIIVCALQAGGLATFALRKACAISPNKLYDMILDGEEGRLVFSGNYFR